MIEFKELTDLHNIMCHKYYEVSKNDEYEYWQRDIILEDIKKLEEIVSKYLDAELNENYVFEKK